MKFIEIGIVQKCSHGLSKDLTLPAAPRTGLGPFPEWLAARTNKPFGREPLDYTRGLELSGERLRAERFVRERKEQSQRNHAAMERRKRSQPCPGYIGPMQTLLNDT